MEFSNVNRFVSLFHNFERRHCALHHSNLPHMSKLVAGIPNHSSSCPQRHYVVASAACCVGSKKSVTAEKSRQREPAGFAQFPRLLRTNVRLRCAMVRLEWETVLHHHRCLIWVKLRNTRNEQIFSTHPPIADNLGGRLPRLSSGGMECFHSISNIPQMPLGERPART